MKIIVNGKTLEGENVFGDEIDSLMWSVFAPSYITFSALQGSEDDRVLMQAFRNGVVVNVDGGFYRVQAVVVSAKTELGQTQFELDVIGEAAE